MQISCTYSTKGKPLVLTGSKSGSHNSILGSSSRAFDPIYKASEALTISEMVIESLLGVGGSPQSRVIKMLLI